jgi:hypothetical protein
VAETRRELTKSGCSSKSEIFVPARSNKQQMAAGAALAAKRGKRPKPSLRGPSRQMAKLMAKKQLRDIAKTKRKNLPTRRRKRR